jgi:amino acid adenylation domain-containing protein
MGQEWKIILASFLIGKRQGDTMRLMNQSLQTEKLLSDYWGLVKQALRQYGTRPLIVTAARSTSHGEANQRANVVFQAIKKNVKQTGIGFGLYMEDPHEVIPAMMGVLKSGNYFVPLDITYPQTTILEMIETAQLKVILTNGELKDKVRSYTEASLPIINIDQFNYQESIEDPIVNYAPEDVVQILFTSGSTGQPKGAIEDYRYLMRAVSTKLFVYEYEPDERILQTTKFTFAGPHLLVFTALLNGNGLYYYDLAGEGIAGLPDWIRKNELTACTSVPTVFRNLISILDPSDSFPSVHTVSFGGEKRSFEEIGAIRQFFPNTRRIRLGFNSTETQEIASTIFPLNYNFDPNQLPSGEPYHDLNVYIWDKDGNSMSQGQEGEIVVHGNALARGYINNPELTRKKFIPDPDHPGWQYYKTGDLGKLSSDGQLIHLGRIDNVVKIKGIRVELDSIEKYLLSYPGITHVASKAFDDPRGNKRLATYFVAKESANIPIPELRKYLAERLPKNSLPHFLIPLEQLPRTDNNKIAFNKLPPPEMVRPDLPNAYVPPEDELEEKLLELWENQLGIQGIGVTDDFFDLGGDSLLGALLFAAVEETLGRELPVSILLTAPTIREQSIWIRDKDSKQDFAVIIPIRPSGDQAPLFFIPGKGGYPTRIRELAKRLDERIPVYACQDLISRKNSTFYHSVEATASFFLEEIRKIYPHGPYILVGESVGGKVAFEIAQMLINQGETTPLVILLDTFNNDDSSYEDNRTKLGNYYPMLVRKHIFILSRSNWQGKLDYIKFYMDLFAQKIKQFLSHENERKSEAAVALPDNIKKMEAKTRMASQYYVPKSYPGKVILLKALRETKAVENTNGWGKVQIGELITHPIDCYHGSILFEPAVSQVAGIIQFHVGLIKRETLTHDNRFQ